LWNKKKDEEQTEESTKKETKLYKVKTNVKVKKMNVETKEGRNRKELSATNVSKRKTYKESYSVWRLSA
jgi:hypothetical protein